MDLPYPSYRKSEACEQSVLNSMNKKLRSTIWSVNDLAKHDQNLPVGVRNNLVKCIEKNHVNRLKKIVDKQNIVYETEIGCKGSKWAFLHFCARWDAITCLEMILKDKYRTNPNEFLFFMNAKTCEGYTPLMIAILYDSSRFIQEFLDYGGIDIFLVDNNKVTAYQMAISQKNPDATKRLVEYQTQNKVTTFLNTYKLSSKFEAPVEEKKCSCSWLWRWFLKQPKQQSFIDTATNRPLTNSMYIDPEFPAIARSVCQDVQSVTQQNIQWLRISELFTQKTVPLFESCNAFQIKQPNFVLKHSLVVFQSMVQYPWIIRTKIKKPSVDGMYTCLLYPKGQETEIVVDDLVPCLKSKKQPMFFHSSKELWPMILQKAWVKSYGSYTLARNISPHIIFQEILGFHSQTFLLSERAEGLYSKFKNLTKKGYLVVLTAKPQSTLREDDYGPESFGLLSLTQKQGKQYFLINCPFVLAEWKEKQKSQALALRLIRSHYNCANQMAVWMDSEQLHSNFASFTVCFGDPSLKRFQIKTPSGQCVFFKYQCHDNISSQQLLLKVFKKKGEYCQVKIKEIEMSKDDSISTECILDHQDSYNTLKVLEVSKGSYICKLEFEERNIDVIVVGYCQYSIHFEVLDEEFGKIEWLYMLRDKVAESLPPNKRVVERFYNYLLIVVRVSQSAREGQEGQEGEREKRIPMDFERVEYVIQGFRETDCVILEKYEDYLYGILKIKENGDILGLRDTILS